MEFRSLRDSELNAWVAHCGYVFIGVGHAVDNSYFLRHFNNDPWRDVNGIFVAVDNDKIVSTVRVFRRKVWLMGSQIPMGGIGEVSTHPDYRGQGLAGTLLNMATDWMAQQGLNVSLLFAGAFDFYRRFGWECIPRLTRMFTQTYALPCEGRVLRSDDLPELQALEADLIKTNWMVVRTDPQYWQSWMVNAIHKAVVATERNRIVAWLAYSTDEEAWSVTEFTALPGYEYKFDGLCALAAEFEGRIGRPYTAPAWLATANTEGKTTCENYNMVKLVVPFAAGGVSISSTQELIDVTKEVWDSSLDHF
jgi:GNAT superfamily N-acetyltransferase